jgi:hypothetical protein
MGTTMAKQAFYVGDRHKTKYGIEYEIIKYNTSRDITIRFDCGYEKSVQGVSIHRGTIEYPLHKTCMGIGYVGFGKHPPTIKNIRTNKYQTWYNMFVRCYQQGIDSENSPYKGVYVDDSWHNFQVFSDWFDENYIDGFCLDKDLTIRWNKKYCPEACSFVPNAINVLMTDHRADRGEYPIGVSRRGNKFCARCFDGQGRRTWLGLYETPEIAFEVYKEYKESIMKNMANEYKHCISSEVYNNLTRWDVVPYPEDYR